MVDLTYRPLEPTDLPALTDIVSNWEVVRQLGSWPWPHDAEFTASRCKSHVGDGFVWGIIHVGRLVGTNGVTDGRIGYSLRRDRWGRGIMSMAAQDAVSHAFSTPTLAAIHGDFWATMPLRPGFSLNWALRQFRPRSGMPKPATSRQCCTSCF